MQRKLSAVEKELELARSSWENAVNGQVAAENALKAIHAKVVYRLQGGDLATDTRCLVEIATISETILPTE